MKMGTPRRTPVAAPTLRVAALGAIAVAAFASAASAAPTCTGGVTAGSTYTCVPNGSGSVQVKVPARVTAISVVADGGGGGKNESLGNGGSGARVSSTISVTPGDVLTISPGAGGGAGLGGSSNAGGTGYGTGGGGGPFYGEGFGGGYGGGGGGSSALLVNGTVDVVAGGGGGGGNSYGGSASAAAGAGGGPGVGTCALGGGGGNAAGGGSAGTTTGRGNSYPMSTSGFAGKGGNGIYGAGGSSNGGGGGGAGYGGGGGGNWNGPWGCTQAGGGGAGGSYGASGTSAVFGTALNAGGVATSGAGGDGQVVVTFIAPAATVPQAPTDLVFNDVTTNSMTAHWTPPADDGGSAITEYEVTVTPGTTTRVASTTMDLTGLTSGATYSVSVKAVNPVGTSVAAVTGTQATGAPPPPQTPTLAATNLVFSNVTSSSITAAWTPPAQVPDWPILGYQVQVDGGTLTWTFTPGYTASGLAPGVSHDFAIYVVNGLVRSPVVTGSQSTPATVPDPPTGLVFSNVTSTATTVSWSAPAPGHDGGSAILGYQVSVDGGTPVPVAGTTYTAGGIGGLLPSTWHTYSIVAQNAVGVSTSDLWGAISTAAPPGSPTMTASPAVVGSPSTITLTGFPASSPQTVQVIAPDLSTAAFDVDVDADGIGRASYTPTQVGTFTVVTEVGASSAVAATFTATAPPSAGSPVEPTPTGTSSTEIGAGGSAPHVASSITIVGRAGKGARAGWISAKGTTAGLAGTRVVAHVRLAGKRVFVTAGTRRVDARGRFTWQWRAGRSATVFFTGAGGTRSNQLRIVVPALRG